MLTTSVCFAPSHHLPGRRTHRLQSSRPASCVISQKSARLRKRNFRVLSPAFAPTERSPLPPRYHIVPRIGRIVEGVLGIPAAVIERQATHGSNYFLHEMVHICVYQTIADIFRSPDVFINTGFNARLGAMFPGNPMVLDGKAHDELRGLLTPAFVHCLFPLYYSTIQKRTSQRCEQVFKTFSTTPQVQIRKSINPFYLGTIIELTAGLQMDDSNAKRICHLFEQVINGLLTFNLGPIGKPAYNAQAELFDISRNIFRDCNRDSKQIIEELRTYCDDFPKHRTRGLKEGNINFLIVLIATSSLTTAPGAYLDDVLIQQLVCTLCSLWFAGYETNSFSTLSSLFELGFNPDVAFY